MLHNNVTFLQWLTYLILCHIYCRIKKNHSDKKPKRGGGQILWSITFILEALYESISKYELYISI